MKTIVTAVIFLLFIAVNAPGLMAREADGTQKGRFYLEVKGGLDQGLSGEVKDETIKRADYPRMGWLAFMYGTPDQSSLSLLVYASAPRPRMRAGYGEFAFEYTLTDWFGIGFDFHNSQYEVRNVKARLASALPQDFTTTMVILSSQSRSVLDNIILLETLQPILRKDVQVFNIATSDFNATFHILSQKMIDPYFRIFIGAGRENYSQKPVIRIGSTFGVRLYFSHAYFLAEASGAGNFVQVTQESSGNESGGDVWMDLSEGYAQIGLGVTL